MTTSEPLSVYLVSTFSDLAEYRAVVVDVVSRFGLKPILLEHFPAAESSPLRVIFDIINDSDIVILLLAHRLGSRVAETDKSVVELEYEYAKTHGKPILAFVLDDEAPWPPRWIDRDSRPLRAFRTQILSNEVVSIFTTPDDLAIKVAAAVSRFSRRIPTPNMPITSPSEILEEITLADVVGELKALRVEIQALSQTVTEFLKSALKDSVKDTGAVLSGPAAADFLGPPSGIDASTCFVIMPYSKAWSNAVERIIFEICSQVGVRFQIAKSMDGRFIPHDIWRGITSAGIIVADLSGANPNVTYEIGLADVLGKEIIMISQDSSVPFDFQAQRLVIYEDSLAGTLKLREELTSRLERYKARVQAEAAISNGAG